MRRGAAGVVLGLALVAAGGAAAESPPPAAAGATVGVAVPATPPARALPLGSPAPGLHDESDRLATTLVPVGRMTPLTERAGTRTDPEPGASGR